MENKQCTVHTTLSVIGGKWKPVILWYLQQNKSFRFNELSRTIEGITQKMLTQQLKELEKDGLVSRKVFAEVPPHVEYSITEYGKTLNPVLLSMSEWGEKHDNRKQTG